MQIYVNEVESYIRTFSLQLHTGYLALNYRTYGPQLWIPT